MFSRNSDKCKAYYFFHIFKKLWQMQRVLFTSCIQETLTNAKCIIYIIYSRNSDTCEAYYLFIYSRNSDKCKEYCLLYVFKNLGQIQSVLFTSYIQETLNNAEHIIAWHNRSTPSPRFITQYAAFRKHFESMWKKFSALNEAASASCP